MMPPRILLCALTLFTALLSQQSVAQNPGAGSIGLANPASEHCVRLGGMLQMERTPAGERGMCILPSGARCEEWALFRGQCRPNDHARPPDNIQPRPGCAPADAMAGRCR